jgi:hypothetical protein
MLPHKTFSLVIEWDFPEVKIYEIYIRIYVFQEKMKKMFTE